jgi:hypothetical protein
VDPKVHQAKSFNDPTGEIRLCEFPRLAAMIAALKAATQKDAVLKCGGTSARIRSCMWHCWR